LKRVLLHIPLILLALMMLSPLVWLVCAAFKNSADLYTYAFLPWDHLHALTGDNFRKLWTQYPYARWVMNSMFLASAHTVISVALCSLAGFALAMLHGWPSSSLLRRRFTSSGTSSAKRSIATVPGRGEYLKMKLFLKRQSRTSSTVLLRNPRRFRSGSRR
jgi:ABC-type uncharacterized transport system permease subunit